MQEQQRPEDQWPAIVFAYDFVKPSYDWMVSRLEAAVTRSQAILAIATTITLGFPVLGVAVNKTISFRSWSFAIAIVSFFALVLVGLVARHTGDLTLMSPGALYNHAAHMSEWEFKRYVLYYAGKHFDDNVAVTNQKVRLGTAMSALLVLEASGFLVWLVKASPSLLPFN
jgi:hypothetical protein